MEQALEILKVVLPALAAIIAFLYRVLRKAPRSWLQALGVGVAAGLLVYGAIKLFEAIRPTLRVAIVRPADGADIECQRVSEDGYCIHSVEGSISGTLSGGKKLYVLVKERGGDEWWVAGGAIEAQDLVSGTWVQPWASFGAEETTVRHYLLSAIVTPEQLAPGQKLRTIPSDVAAFTTISVRRK